MGSPKPTTNNQQPTTAPEGRSRPRIAIIFGTRPEAVKMAPVVQSFKAENRLETIVIVTAQHREMLDQVMATFDIGADHDLDIMSPGQSLTTITNRVLTGIDDLLKKTAPDMILVQGDTTTVFASSLAAFYNRVAVGHVEAGLRTDDKYNPFPEEINRRLTGVMADLHFAPTTVSRDNLLREGVPAERIMVTGNTVIDSLMMVAGRPYSFAGGELARLEEHPGRVVLITAHRRENWGAPMQSIARALARLAHRYPDTLFVFPMHRNPEVRGVVTGELDDLANVMLIEPQDYEPFVHLMKRSHLIITDSGGVQEEAPSLGIPVLVLRERTERPEAVDVGTVRLVGTDEENIFTQSVELMDDEEARRKMAGTANPYGDGKSSERILAEVMRYFNLEVVI